MNPFKKKKPIKSVTSLNNPASIKDTNMTELRTAVSNLYVGSIKDRWPGKAPSAIGKVKADGKLFLTETGFETDQQADLKVHGGPDKAVHHYSADHYIRWRSELPEYADKLVPGGFGENVSTSGFVEKDLCIGDVFALGSARVQISQGRQPCWKLNLHIGDNRMVKLFQDSGSTGWYYRVLETGSVEAGDMFELLDRPQPDWSLDQVIAARFDRKLDPRIAASLSELPELAVNWREAFAKKKDKMFREDTRARISGS